MLKHIQPKTPKEFFERLFWKNPSMVDPAMRIYDMIKKGEFKDRNMVMHELGLSIGQYYYILRVLKALGLICKQYGEWKTSREFVKRLERLIEFVEEW